MRKKRLESDALGSKSIDIKRLWGAQTQRSLENFNIGNEKMPKEIINAIGYQKKAAALANIELGELDKTIGKYIIKACDQIINSHLINEFPLSVWQTGSGTHTNMNANEVIANYAIKQLKGNIGTKKPVHPNDHVNLSQSSNDVFPTIMHIACIKSTNEKLLKNLNEIISEFRKKIILFNKIIKIGRTHLQDATPLTLGQEFSGYHEQLSKNKERILSSLKDLYFLSQGGTAVGTGINSPKNFDKIFCKHLSKITKMKFFPTK